MVKGEPRVDVKFNLKIFIIVRKSMYFPSLTIRLNISKINMWSIY